MGNGMKTIDLNNWPRRAHYEFFRTFDDPFFDVSARVDVTELVNFVRRTDRSLFATLMHTALRAANATRNLRYRFRGDQVLEVDTNHASFTLLDDDETFNYATALYCDDLDEFSERIRRSAGAQRNRQDLNLDDDHRLELVYITSMPWLDFQSISHPMPGDPADCAPRIAWGKVVEVNQGHEPRHEVTVQLTVHHALADGLHSARFFEHFRQFVGELA